MQPFSKNTHKNQPTYLSINFKQPKDYNLCTNIQPTNNHYTNFQLTNNQQTPNIQTNKQTTYTQHVSHNGLIKHKHHKCSLLVVILKLIALK